MKTASSTELTVFHRFLGEQLETGSTNLSPEQAVAVFRAQQQDLKRLRKAIDPAHQRSLRGQSKPINLPDLKAKVTRRLAKRGVRD